MDDQGINDDIVDELVDSILDFSQDTQEQDQDQDQDQAEMPEPETQSSTISIVNNDDVLTNNNNVDDGQQNDQLASDINCNGLNNNDDQYSDQQQTIDANNNIQQQDYGQIIDYNEPTSTPFMHPSNSMHQVSSASPLDVIPEQSADFIANQQEQVAFEPSSSLSGQLVDLDSINSSANYENIQDNQNYDEQQQQQFALSYPNEQPSVDQEQQQQQAAPIYSTINKQRVSIATEGDEQASQSLISNDFNNNITTNNNETNYAIEQQQHYQLGPPPPTSQSLVLTSDMSNFGPDSNDGTNFVNDRILTRRGERGAVESGSFRHNFKKKLPSSLSATDNDLTLHRRKLLESTTTATTTPSSEIDPTQNAIINNEQQLPGGSFKKNQLVSFNVNRDQQQRNANANVTANVNANELQPNTSFGRSGGRVSVDIRQLPSYLTNKRASIVDVARGAVSSLFHLASGGSSASGSHKRDSASSRSPSVGSESGGSDSGGGGANSEEELPIFEEPIAPTLSLGQRVAWVSGDGPEFGTVSWIGQLAEVDDDWVVGVIFDNMIGNTDGQYKGTRYFYSRENYSMFLPLNALTKTDNYIGRPETGTMLSRMSVQLKPGQLISIQRSSIRLQHCFLNAPHQRVGHDVRAVSNRLHCQCHTCGPCAHLTKQGQRIHGPLPHFRAQHTHHDRKKNSLAQAAIELLAHHHHHHFHEEEDHHVENEDHQFGENAAHACNYVRYSCCQQTGVGNHTFLADCEMVRPELLDNLIHAPKAPPTTAAVVALGRTKSARRAARRAARKQAKSNLENQQQQQLALASHIGNDATIKSWQTNSSAGNQSTYATTNTASSYYDTNTMTTTTTNQNTLTRPSSSGSIDSGEESDNSSGSSSASDNEHEALSNKAINQTKSHQQFHLNQPSIAPNAIQPVPVTTSPLQPVVPSTLMGYSHDTNFINDTMDINISLMDQRRFIQQRESSAFVHSRYSYGSQTSIYSDQSRESRNNRLGSRIGRCFNWCFFNRQTGNQNHRRSSSRNSKRKNSSSSRRKSNTSTRDKIIEYRRKQSTFVPLTLAKPQEDFASHAVLMPNQSNSIISSDEINYAPIQSYNNNNSIQPIITHNITDYGHSPRSSTGSALRFDDTGGLVTGMGDYATDCNEPNFHNNNNNNYTNNSTTDNSSSAMDDSNDIHNLKQQNDDSNSDRLLMMKCSPPQLVDNDNCSCCNENGDDDDDNEKKSQLLSSQADLGFYTNTYDYNTHTSSSSNDTLKHIVDECINEQVSAPQPTSEYLATLNAISPEISIYQNVDGNNCPYGDNEYDISSPTASVDVDNQIPPECHFDEHYNTEDDNEQQTMQELFDNLAVSDSQDLNVNKPN